MFKKILHEIFYLAKCFVSKSLFRKEIFLCSFFFKYLYMTNVLFSLHRQIHIFSTMLPLRPLLKYEGRRLPMKVDIGGWLSIFYQFGSTCSGAGFCPANHPLAPAFTPRWVHPIRFAYYDTIYLHHCTRVDESRPTSRSFSPSINFFISSTLRENVMILEII